ncbi:MAG: hypothetical protein LBH80_01870 [Prevotellaceae bacterium]|nr:hypothetical protein [Prevotellaceae bacterium]
MRKIWRLTIRQVAKCLKQTINHSSLMAHLPFFFLFSQFVDVSLSFVGVYSSFTPVISRLPPKAKPEYSVL